MSEARDHAARRILVACAGLLLAIIPATTGPNPGLGSSAALNGATASIVASARAATDPAHGSFDRDGAALSDLRLLNYYPARRNWSRLWSDWDPAALDADFARIADLHANAVRLCLQAWTFGYPTPRAVMLDRLRQAVALAWAHGLRVELTLFDWWGSYGDVDGSRRWARMVLAPYAGDPRVAAVELKNEVDPSDPAVMRWARAMIPYTRDLAGGIPVTLSVSDLAGLRGLARLVTALRGSEPDVYSYHFYGGGDPAAVYATVREAQRLVAPVPLFVGETGFPTSSDIPVPGLPATTPALEAYQDHYLRTVESAVQRLGLPLAAPWTLTDFTPGSLAWAPPQSVEYHYGLYRADGTPKPAAASLRHIFAGNAVDTSFNNGFETPAGSLPAEWLLCHSGEARFARDAAVAHTGHASARIDDTGAGAGSPDATGDGAGVAAFYISPIDADVTPGRLYTAAAWARGRAAGGATRVALAWFDAAGRYLGQAESPRLPRGDVEWTHLVARGVAPAGAAYVQVYLKSERSGGTVWFDDVSFG